MLSIELWRSARNVFLFSINSKARSITLTYFFRFFSRPQEISRRLPVRMLDSPSYLSLFDSQRNAVGTVTSSIVSIRLAILLSSEEGAVAVTCTIHHLRNKTGWNSKYKLRRSHNVH